MDGGNNNSVERWNRKKEEQEEGEQVFSPQLATTTASLEVFFRIVLLQ